MRLRVLAAVAAAVGMAAATAAPVSINTPFINLENRAINSLGFTAGKFLRIGAVSVTPNGSEGTTGLGTHVLPDGSTLVRPITFNPSPVIPNFYSRLLDDLPDRRGDWTLTFTNGSDSASRTVNISETAQQVPFVDSITLSGTSANPTFSWTPPPGVRVDKYRINIYDKDRIAAGLGGQVTSRDVLPSQTSYTVTAADFTVPGFEFQLNKNYAIEISVIQTKDGTSNSANSNLQAIARVYADFRPTEAGTPLVNLPVVVDGAYQFNMAVVPGQTYFIDPEVAIGYDYAIGNGNPNFATVLLPTGIGDGLYDLWGYDDASQPILLADDLAGGKLFNFGDGGVSRFRVTGIETSAGLDPNNTTAFITGLTFTGRGQFTGTQTPIRVTINDVPEAPTLALALAGLGLAGWRRRRGT